MLQPPQPFYLLHKSSTLPVSATSLERDCFKLPQPLAAQRSGRQCHTKHLQGKVQSTKLTAQRATSFQRPSAQSYQPRVPRYGRLWDARSAKPGQEIACTSTPDWIDWHPARSELAVLDEAGLLVFVDTRRAGKLLSSRKTDCEVNLALGVSFFAATSVYRPKLILPSMRTRAVQGQLFMSS